MAVSIRKAFKNVLSDEDFLSKYAVLVVLSFCNGLLTFALLAKNYMWILPALALSITATVIAFGYDLKYIRSLIDDENAKMPEWSGILEYTLNGIKYLGAVMLFAMATSMILIIPMLVVAILAVISKVFLILMSIPVLLFILVELYVCIASIGFVYVFLDSDMDICSLFNFKKIFSYFSINYFTALFTVGTLALCNALLGGAATINIKYALLYLIPLMLAPFLRMGINNIIAQAYNSNKNEEKGSLAKMFGYLLLFIVAAILLIFVSILSKHAV